MLPLLTLRCVKFQRGDVGHVDKHFHGQTLPAMQDAQLLCGPRGPILFSYFGVSRGSVPGGVWGSPELATGERDSMAVPGLHGVPQFGGHFATHFLDPTRFTATVAGIFVGTRFGPKMCPQNGPRFLGSLNVPRNGGRLVVPTHFCYVPR